MFLSKKMEYSIFCSTEGMGRSITQMSVQYIRVCPNQAIFKSRGVEPMVLQRMVGRELWNMEGREELIYRRIAEAVWV